MEREYNPNVTLEEYIIILDNISPLTEEQKENIREVRSWDKMTTPQLKELCRTGIVLRTKAFSKDRNIFCKDDGTLWYWQSQGREFQIVGYFKDAETAQLKELRKKYSDKRREKRRKKPKE